MPEVPAQPVPKSDRFFYGGQAVVEGVMMRGRRHYAVAVRLPDGNIKVRSEALHSAIYVSRLWRKPLLRGLAMLAEQLHLGMKSLIWSAGVNAGEQDVEIGKKEIIASVVIGIAVSALLFIGLPLLGAGFAVRHSGSFGFVLVEGLIRVVIVIAYLGLIGLMKDVRRIFQYHGAEHKTINALERGWKLEPASVRPASRLHPRCGTGFLIVVLVVSVLVFSLVAAAQPNWFWLIVSRLVGIPVIASLSYEWIRLLAKYPENPVVKVLLVPVLYTQKLTTREPDDGMLEVAIAALEAARAGDSAPEPAEQAPAPAPKPVAEGTT